MTLTIPANDHGKIRVFALLSTPSKEVQELDPDAIADLFGYDALNLDYVDVVDIDATEDLGLLGLIEQGYDITPDATDIAALSPLTGWVILIMSRATLGADATLKLAPTLTHVTTLGDKATLVTHDTIETSAAKGTLETPTKPAKSDARIGGMVATVVLILMFVLVGAMIWIAG